MAFPAVPIFFYNQIDGRGPISIRDSFDEHYDTIRWWAEQGKPLEINDPHQWGLRYASDDLQVTDHVLVRRDRPEAGHQKLRDAADVRTAARTSARWTIWPR